MTIVILYAKNVKHQHSDISPNPQRQYVIFAEVLKNVTVQIIL